MVATGTTTVTPITAVVAVGPAHHCRGAFLVLVDLDGNEADDVRGQSHLALELGHGLMGRVNIHKRVMGFTVFLNAIGEGLETPIFGLADLATVFLKQGTEGL